MIIFELISVEPDETKTRIVDKRTMNVDSFINFCYVNFLIRGRKKHFIIDWRSLAIVDTFESLLNSQYTNCKHIKRGFYLMRYDCDAPYGKLI